jgi:hypothetical protein
MQIVLVYYFNLAFFLIIITEIFKLEFKRKKIGRTKHAKIQSQYINTLLPFYLINYAVKYANMYSGKMLFIYSNLHFFVLHSKKFINLGLNAKLYKLRVYKISFIE